MCYSHRFAWVGASNAAYLRKAKDTLDIADGLAREKLMAELRVLCDLDFSGIHYDIGPIEDGDSHDLELLQTTRQTIPGRLLSSVCPQLQPPGIPVKFP